MKWLLVVLVGGVAPVQTDVVFEKLSDCLAAEQQLRTAYAAAFEAQDRQVTMDLDQLDRHERRNYYRERREDKRVANTGTCIPHSGTDQVITSLNKTDQPQPQAPSPAPPPSPRP
ncbi:hypothetical protein [Bradyrhizobium genosp. P]|uniref:hypothetical protein n=1 Tax=Bradyrhizobium genosp. P TaxID=83641 RepID=UPI003CF7FD8E